VVKVKYDISKSDPEQARAAGNFEAPKPGIYRYQISEVNAGFSKDGDNNQDKSRPRLEIIFSCLDEKYKGSQVWLYIPMPGSTAENEFSTQKLDQLLQAVGFSDGKRNRKGEFDSDKVLKGKVVKVRVRGGSNQSGDYRAEYGSVFPDDGVDADGDTLTSDDELMEEDEEVMEDEVMEDEEEAFDAEARMAELSQMSVSDLKGIGKEYGIKLGGLTKSTLVDAIVAAEAEEAEAEEEVEEDEIMEDEEVMEDEEDVEYLTRDGLMAMDRAELAQTARDFDITPAGMKRSEVIEAILEAQAAPEEDEEPF
jgi:hypothetical protein